MKVYKACLFALGIMSAIGGLAIIITKTGSNLPFDERTYYLLMGTIAIALSFYFLDISKMKKIHDNQEKK